MVQTTVIDMEWNTKWDWENHDIFSSKGVAISSPKKLQSSEDIDGSFNLSAAVNNDNNSSSNFSSDLSRSFQNTCNKMNGNSPSFEGSACSSDQSIGLKLGKRTYFENGLASSDSKTRSSQNVGVSSLSNVKKVKISNKSTSIARCQVEGCDLDLSSAKEYHKKHRVCGDHSKALKVVVAGLERRFCQQCSRFHGLTEFDGKKRSCRRRLSNHNARRRKPPQEAIHFNSSNLSSSFYDGQQHLGFVFNNVPVVHTKPALNSVWETTCIPQQTAPAAKAEKPEAFQFQDAFAFNRIMPPKSTAAGAFHQGSNAEALDFRRALSLLSNSSWGSCESDFSGLEQPMYANGLAISQQGMHSGHHGLPPECWQIDQQFVDAGHIQFQESRILKAPYGIQYANPVDEILKPL